MKKKNGGFIATSLIYSFFLVFIAIMAALLNNYIANKRILDRFNEDAEKELNMDTYNVTIISKNASIRDGIVLTNILENSDFSEGDSFWNMNDSFTNQLSYIEKKIGADPKDNIYQNVILKNDVKYYYSLEYKTQSESTYYARLNDNGKEVLSSLELSGSLGSERRISDVYKSIVDDQNASFSIGESDSASYETYSIEFTHAMLINLTDAFGKGNEPVSSWIDRNIAWFDGTIGIKSFNLSKGLNSFDVTFVPYETYTEYTITCDSNYEVEKNVGEELETSKGRTLTFNDIDRDLVCTVEWKIENEE